MHYQTPQTSTLFKPNFSFFEHLDRIMEEDYMPNHQDILNVRVITRQISDTIFTISNQRFHFFDVLPHLTLGIWSTTRSQYMDPILR